MRSNKIRILYITYSLEPGGAERVLLNYVRFLDKAQFEPVVCVIGKSGPLETEIVDQKVRLKVITKKRGIDLGALMEVIALLKKEKPHIVHLHLLPAIIWGTLACLLSKSSIIVRTDHNVIAHMNKLSLDLKIWFGILLGIFHKRIISVCDEVKRSFQKRDLFSRKKYVTIYNGIDPLLFEASSTKDYWHEFAVPNSAKIVGTVASLTPQKGHCYLLESIKTIVAREPKVYFLIIGDGPLRSNLKSKAIKLGIEQNVIFTGVRRDIAELLRFMDVFVLPSLWEGFPMTILEAMACKKPVVATNVGGNSEAVIHGQTGIMVPARDNNFLANAILRLLRDDKMSREMGEKGRQKVLNHFTAQRMVKETEGLYKEMLYN